MTKLEIILVAVVAAMIALLVWSYHERTVGAAALKLADAKALFVAEQKAAAQTVALQAQVNAAHQETVNAQKQTDDYIAAHPIPVVRVCHIPPRSPVPEAASAAPGVEGASTAAPALPEVSTGSAGPDISEGLTVLMQAAARLAVLQQESQLVSQ